MAREALLVGNTATYSHGARIASVPFLGRTLNRIGTVLSSLPAQYSFRVTTLIDETPGEVRRNLDVIAERTGATGGLLLFYYFGHALLSPALELLLVHPGPDATSPRTLRLPALEAMVAASDVTKSLFILDCCYAGAQIRPIAFALTGQHCRLASTTPSARAYLATGSLHDPVGSFTRALLHSFSSPDACRSATDNTITAESLFNYASGLTLQLTHGTQQPIMLGSLAEPLTEYRRVPEIISGVTTTADEKTAYRKLLAIIQIIRHHQPIPDIGSLYNAVLDEYPDAFLTLHKNSDGSFKYLPVQEQVMYRYVRLLRLLGLVDSDQLTLTKAGIGLVANMARSYNTRLLQSIDDYFRTVGISREEIDGALASILSSRRVPSRGELLDYLILGGHRFPKQELATILDLLGYIGAILMSPGRAYFPW